MPEYVWASHSSTCKRCCRVDLQKTATVANACVTGAEMLKLAMNSLHRRKLEARAREELDQVLREGLALARATIDKARAP